MEKQKCVKGKNCCLCEDCKQERRGKLKLSLVLSLCIIPIATAIITAIILQGEFNILAVIYGVGLLYVGAWYLARDLIYLAKNNDSLGVNEQ